MNPQWKVMATIAFIDGNIKFPTYKDHDGRDARMMIHECCWEHHLPFDKPEQIPQVVTKRITGKKGKSSLYSTES